MGQPRQGRGQGRAVAVQAGVAAADLTVHVSGNVAEIMEENRDEFPEILQESESVIISDRNFVLCYFL